MKFGPKYYWKPTNFKIRKIGDALLALSTAFMGYEILFANNPTLATIIMILGVAGKFLTNFFSEDKDGE